MRIKEMLRLARPPSILLLGVLYMAYVLVGGVVFWQLEGHLVQQHVDVLLHQKEQLLGTYACLDQGALEEVAQVSRSPPPGGHTVTLEREAVTTPQPAAGAVRREILLTAPVDLELT